MKARIEFIDDIEDGKDIDNDKLILKELSEAEAWKMIALANIYWLKHEKEWRKNKSK